MSVASDRMQFIALTMKDTEIARATGIPRNIVTQVRLEQRALPSAFRLPLRRIYEQRTYHMLRDAGVSSYESRRFQWYSPGRLRELVEQVNRQVIHYAGGAAASRIRKLTDEGKPVDFESIFKEEIVKVKEGINRSREPLEEILAY